MRASWRVGWMYAAVTLAVAFAAGPADAAAPNEGDSQQAVSISVLSLFHPGELRVGAAENSVLEVAAGNWHRQLIGGSVVVVDYGNHAVQVRLGSERESAAGVTISSLLPDGTADFWLEVPGKLRRRYQGTLKIQGRGQMLEAIVTMPVETAVASIVEAESPPGAPLEALKAQAVAARSFLLARQAGHRTAGGSFDFCDTTHCQFLRSPPAPGSRAAQATEATAGLILSYRDRSDARQKTLPAMYARSCGGRTRTLAQIGIRSPAGYPYYAVACRYCLQHPEVAPLVERARQPATERERLAWNRIHGWGAVPSLSGRGIGHGVGLCQLGAADMALRGATFTEILAHYYPNTRLAPAPVS